MTLSSGYIVEFIAKGSVPEAAAVLNVSGNNVRLLLANGKETNIPEKKILYASTRAITTVSDRELCKQNLININNIREEIAKKIDLSEIRELLVEDPKFYELSEIAEFLYEPDDFNSISALLRRLCEDHIYFKNKNNTYQPLSEDALKQVLELQQKREQQEKEEEVLVESLKKLVANGVFEDSLKAYTQDLKDYVAMGEEANISKRLSAALAKASLANNRKVFRALITAGILAEDENLDLIKYRTPINFTLDQEKEGEELSKRDIDSFNNRTDLTCLKTWAIDSAGSKDRDDAFSFEHTDEGYTLWVHIADPSEIIKPGSILDKEAARRGCSLYMPDLRIHMLPEILSQGFLSLDEGNKRLALSFILKFTSDMELKEVDIKESVIRIEKATDYVSANSLLQSDDWLSSAYDFSEKLKKKRVADGAILLPRQADINIKVEDGRILIEHENRDELTAGMIAEFMIWTNHGAACWFRKNALPCLYRCQDGSPEAVDTIEVKETFDPVVFWKVLKLMQKTVVSPDFGRHFSLGINGYTQVSSPLRRYADLLLHRQIKAFINSTSPMQQNELSQRVMVSDIAVNHADDTMKNREKYYMLKYLKEKQKSEEVIFDAIVVDTSSMTEVNFYVDFLCAFRHCRKPAFDVAPGMKIKVKVNQIDLFDNIVRFDLRQS